MIEWFNDSDEDRSFLAAGMRSIAEDLAEMLEHLKVTCCLHVFSDLMLFALQCDSFNRACSYRDDD